MKKIISFVFLILLNLDCLANDKLTSSYIADHSFPKKMIISVPFTDLRKKPVKTIPNLPYPIFCKDNPLQESQLLMGEYIHAFNEKIAPNGEIWLQIYALEQVFFNGSNWIYKEGWIEKKHTIEVIEYPSYNLVVKAQWINVLTDANPDSDAITNLSIGTKLIGKKINNGWYKIFLPDGKSGYVAKSEIHYLKATIDETENMLREKISETATTFLNSPYSWGGRSGYNKFLDYQQTSVDCSGFTNLTYRSLGLEIPRDANDQFIKSNKLKSGKDIKPGDLIFFAYAANPQIITHVSLFIKDEFFGTMLTESIGEWPHKNRMITDIIRFGKKIDQIKNGETCGNYVIYFGSFLNDPNTVTELRATSLKNYFAEFREMNTNFTATSDSFDYKANMIQR